MGDQDNGFDSPVPLPPPPPVHPHHASCNPVPDAEPWYYRFASGWINITMWLGVGLVVLPLSIIDYIGVWALLRLPPDDVREGLVAAVVVLNLWALFVVIAILFGSALDLIFVDMARQLRRLNDISRSQPE
jgi:hypothetical protein